MAMATPLAVSSTKPPVTNVWAIRAARRAAPQDPPPRAAAPPPPPPRRADGDPFVVRARPANTNTDPWPTVGRANPNPNPNLNVLDKLSSPPPQRRHGQSRTPAQAQNPNGSAKKPSSNSKLLSNTPPKTRAAVSSHTSTPPQTIQSDSPSVSAPEPYALASNQSPTTPLPPSPSAFASASTSTSASVASTSTSPSTISTLPSTPSMTPATSSFVPTFPLTSAFPTLAESASASPSKGASRYATPARSANASGAVSPSRGAATPVRGAESASASGRTSPSPSNGGTSSGKTKTRKWVPIPAEELRAAADAYASRQRGGPNGNGNGIRERDGRDRGERERGRRSQGPSGTTSRAESVGSMPNSSSTRDPEGAVFEVQYPHWHQHEQQSQPSGEVGVEMVSPRGQAQLELQYPPQPQQEQGWRYLPMYAPSSHPPPPPPLHAHPAHAPPPPPHGHEPYYPAPAYGGAPAGMGLGYATYWGMPAPWSGMDGGGAVPAEVEVAVLRHPGVLRDGGAEGSGGGGGGGGDANGWAPMGMGMPMEWWPGPGQGQGPGEQQPTSVPVQLTPQTEREPERPPPPAESGAVMLAASISAGGALDGLGGRRIMFGSVDGGLGALADGDERRHVEPPNVGTAAEATMSTPFVQPVWPTETPLSAWLGPQWPSTGGGGEVDNASGSNTTLNSNPNSSAIVTSATKENPPAPLNNSTTGRPQILAIGVPLGAPARRRKAAAVDLVDAESLPVTRTGEYRFEFGTINGSGDVPEYAGTGFGGGPGIDMGMGGMPPTRAPGQAAVYPGYAGAYPMYRYPYTAYDPSGMSMYGPPGSGPMAEGMGMPMGMPPPPMDASSAGGGGGGDWINANRNGGEASEWQVKADYSGRYGECNGPYATREGEQQRNNSYVPRAPRELDQQQQQYGHAPLHQDDRPPRDLDYPPGRPRRGSYNGGAHYEPRGGYGGRRGTFRGRFGRGGGFQPQQGRAPPPTQPQQQQHPRPFEVTPPPRFAPVAHEGYWAPAPYRPASLKYPPQQQHLAPVPTPRTRLTFPIDQLRQEILSQLEFYLSPDNMATDLYLRQQMDSQGWVRIDTLASFKRVQSKTSDVNLVRDVLGLSDYAEIRGEWVRSTEGWEKFVLPTARPSVVDTYTHTPVDDEELDEDEDEEVVFVMGREAPTWSPQRPR